MKIKYKMRDIKLFFYLNAIANLATPLNFYKRKSLKYYKTLTFSQKKDLLKRVNYYNKLGKFSLHDDAPALKQHLKLSTGTYYLDLAEYVRVFPLRNRLNVIFGDVKISPPQPSIVKSRPIEGDNNNSVLLKLNKIRHYKFIEDRRCFEEKKNMAVWRGATYKSHRIEFVKKLYNHPLCNVGGYTKKNRHSYWEKEHLSIAKQLEYKYIFCIEGNDVATNLKWCMSSNSLCLMPKPKFETWFMEGALLPGFHYVQVRDDYSDVEEKINYFNGHPQEALKIIENANRFVDQFKNKYTEDIISFLVLRKYFKRSGQSCQPRCGT
jgi:hypothetical protein